MEYLIKYKDYLKVNGKSKNTIINYLNRIKTLLLTTSIDMLSEETISTFILNKAEKTKPATINNYLNAINSFVNEFLKKNISLPKHRKLEERSLEIITEEFLVKEILPVIKCISYHYTKYSAILYFMLFTGIRVGEFDYLKRKDFDFEKKKAIIWGEKTKKERVVFFPSRVKDLIQYYFKTETEDINAFNVTSIALKKWFNRLKPRFQNINFKAHLFRHSFATITYKKIKDIRYIQKLLGHANLNTTMKYEHTNDEDMRKIYEKIMD